MANHIYDSEDSNFEITSKRRKGFPSAVLLPLNWRMEREKDAVASPSPPFEGGEGRGRQT
jgi:hypothetical protein